MKIEIEQPPLAIIVTGATCGGKSKRALDISRDTGLPVNVMDSMKVYRGMDIGSAKPAEELRNGKPYQMVDLVDPWEEFTVFDWLSALGESASSKDPWLISGGTVFYLHALREGIFQGPGPDDVIRERLKAESKSIGGDYLHDKLKEVDPDAALMIHRHDHKRLVRALEVHEQSGEPISVWHKRRVPILDPDKTLLIGVHRERQEVHRRIKARVVRMFTEGWIDEVQSLLDAHDPPWSDTAGQSIGYQRLSKALKEGTDPFLEADKIIALNRALARSQLVWARKLPIAWFAPDEGDRVNERVQSALDAVKEGRPIDPPDRELMARRRTV
ncbi:MAG: tRNA (adenosine(37)-N6)-dimethylallyltransferase MiaA [Planctomycetia bacterium]|nr:tRNA (adenosine(37)-N6)-dimethylallyltransferase MiaA [Planctomycetia bacterium]